jgi:glycosyltransferase involved in cell wall biosynthesis
VQALAERRGVELRLRWQLPTAALAAEYGAARLCLYAPHAEPLGLVPLEAMACATPVVAVAEGGVPETITDGVTGRLLPRDPRAFSAAVDALLADASARQRLGANGRERVCRDWTWPGAVARLERVLGDVVRSGGKARAQ